MFQGPVRKSGSARRGRFASCVMQTIQYSRPHRRWCPLAESRCRAAHKRGRSQFAYRGQSLRIDWEPIHRAGQVVSPVADSPVEVTICCAPEAFPQMAEDVTDVTKTSPDIQKWHLECF